MLNSNYSDELAIFCHAIDTRLKLYSYLEKLEERVLYYNTGSVIYVSKPGEFEPSTGNFIGDMTDELECYGIGSYITKVVSGGPRNYAYKVYSTKEQSEYKICKVKGIYLNFETSRKIKLDLADMWFQQDGATCHIVRETMAQFRGE